MVIETKVEKAQSDWAGAVIRIGSLKEDRELCIQEAERILCRLYAFDLGPVLFKPTFAKEKTFRMNLEGALSYFVGGNVQYPEDRGFALQNWESIFFENASMILREETALAMGHYFFVNQEGEEFKLEFTFGYLIDTRGELLICLHHSSKP